MGWSSGTYFAGSFIEGIKKAFPHDAEARKKIYRVFIPAMQEADWDCEREAEGADFAYDEVLRELHPTWYVDEQPTSATK